MSEYVVQVGGACFAGICTSEVLWNKTDPSCVLWGLQSCGGGGRGHVDRTAARAFAEALEHGNHGSSKMGQSVCKGPGIEKSPKWVPFIWDQQEHVIFLFCFETKSHVIGLQLVL